MGNLRNLRRVALALLAALLLTGAAAAAAATIRGTMHADMLIGGEGPDRVLARGGDDRVQIAFGGRDSVSCGAGRDIVTADPTDVVAPDCEVVSRRISFDLATNPGAQHETAVEPDSFAYGDTVVAAFQLGRYVDPGAASNIGWATSADAGRTWRSGTLPSLTADSSPAGAQARVSDPAVAYDAVQGAWLIASLAIGPANTTSIMVSRSTDGIFWSPPTEVVRARELDKEWIVCDNGAGSPYRGRCYLQYHHIDQHQSVSQTSTDGGATWAPAVRVGGDDLVGLQPVVLPDGKLVVTSGNFGSGGDEGKKSVRAVGAQLVMSRSLDGGVTFTTPVTISDMQWHPPTQMRALPLPSSEADSAGTVWAAWHDCRFHPACSANDILFIRSSDGGASWTTPTRIPLDPVGAGVDHFLTGLGVDPTRVGRLALVYSYFRRADCVPATCSLEAGFVSSRDGGGTWTPVQPLDAQPSLLAWLPRTRGGHMLGDYYSTSFAGERAVPVFTLATAPLGARFHEAIFAASLPVG